MPTRQKINEWLNSGEYNADIKNVHANIIRKVETSKNESETASIFELEISSLIRNKTSLDLDIQKERQLNGIFCHSFNSSRKSGRGRIDAVINSLVIEYKYNLNSKSQKQINKAYVQVKDYLTAKQKENGEKCDAILTDGRNIAYFQFIGNNISSTGLRPMTYNDIDKIIKGILNDSTKKFEPVNIVRDFSVSSCSSSYSKKIANILFHQLLKSPSDKTVMLYEEWKCLMHLSVNDSGKSNDITKRRQDLTELFSHEIKDPDLEYKALFALQTTYAIIVKLIACKVVDNLNYNSKTDQYNDLINLSSLDLQKFFRTMEDGYSYNNMGVRNFLEGDYFSWYADENDWSSVFYEAFRHIIIQVDEYSAFSLNVRYAPIDVFKDLYMSIIPQSIRHSMGEYFTPEWLVDCVVTTTLKKICKDKQWKAIDPCCGSGIFIISLIKKIVGEKDLSELNEQQKKALIDQIIERVQGIDINPLSVLSARVSYYIAIHAIGEVKDVDIPIYLGDSAIIPKSKDVDNIACYVYTIDNLKKNNFDVILPQRLVKEKGFGLMMRDLQSFVKAEDEQLLYDVFEKELSNQERKSKILCEEIKSLCKTLVYLHKNNWDGIWIRIATNFMMIARLQKFDIIIGNPPWVKWEHLPNAYTEKIKQFCDIRHIFCNDGGMYGGSQLNICALISNVTATNWLGKGGILAFLMPDSIMSQNSYEEFRNFYTNYNNEEQLYLQCIDRWMPPLRPFKCGTKVVSQDFNTYYFGANPVDYKVAGVKVRVIRKKKGVSDKEIDNCLSYDDVSKYLNETYSCAHQLAKDSTAFTYDCESFDFSKIMGKSAYRYRTGVESTPFEIFKLIDVDKSQLPNHYYFKNKALKTSKYKVDDMPKGGWDFPTRLIYPMVEGPNIQPFSYDTGNNYHIIPYERKNTSSPIPIDKLQRRDKELATYFSNHKELLDKQSDKSKSMHRGKEFYALSKIGPYTFAKNLVAARDNTYFCASVIRPTTTAWGEKKMPICVKHTIIISQDSDGNFISNDEAHYINGILNSTIVHEYIHSTFKTNGFSLKKANLYIPKYDPQKKTHKSIVKLSKEASKMPDKRETNAILLTKKYLILCRGKKQQ